jgi:hypothetical protein
LVEALDFLLKKRAVSGKRSVYISSSK